MKWLWVGVLGALTALGLVGSVGPVDAKVPGPNGRIAFARFDPELGDSATYTMDPDGSDVRQLFPGASGNPRWSPDGSKITVGASCVDGGENCAATIVDPDTGAFRQLRFPDPTLETFCSVWSADGRRLACEGHGIADESRNGIYTIRTSDGRGLMRITSNPGGDDSPIDYSPDGKRLVFSRTDPSGPSGSNQALFIVNVNGTGVHRITPWGFSDDDGSWSPDGTRIVFEHFGSLYTVVPDGGGLSKVSLDTKSSTTAFTAFDAGWSPDGTKLVFSLRTKTGSGSVQEGIATANADGSDVQLVTISPTRDEKADWGPHPIVP
jgi:Tol biopolymer transport system component